MSTAPIDAQVVNAVLSPLMNVLRDCAGISANLSQLRVVSSMPSAPCVSVSIEVRGGVYGPITWTFDPDIASAVAQRMLASSRPPSFDSAECTDAVSELANIAVGNATGALAEVGYHVEILPPQARVRTSEATLNERTLALAVPTAQGTLCVLIGLHIG